MLPSRLGSSFNRKTPKMGILGEGEPASSTLELVFIVPADSRIRRVLRGVRLAGVYSYVTGYADSHAGTTAHTNAIAHTHAGTTAHTNAIAHTYAFTYPC